MPYPPPPGPPDVGEFQAIGLLPAPQIPSVVGHNGDFLGTDGIIPEWEPVGGGSLPAQGGNAGKFLTTDGTNAAWSTVAAGGIIAIGAITTPAADGAIISGGNTLQLAPADVTNPGVITAGDQSFAGVKTFTDGAAIYANDIRNFGAISIADPTISATVIHDSIDAIEAAFAVPDPSFVGSVTRSAYLPPGNFAISRPVIVPHASTLYGGGQFLTTLLRGTGTPATPSQVQAFSGPLVYVTGYSPTSPPAGLLFPKYTTPIVGATGQAMQYGPPVVVTGNSFPPGNIWLHDSWSWHAWYQTVAVSNWTLQFWLKLDSIPGGQIFSPIITSTAPFLVPDTTVASAFSFTLSNIGGSLFLIGQLTTTSGINTFTTIAGDITVGGSYNVELGYDGSFVDFYLNGVNKAHIAASGPIVQEPWENVSIGKGGTETGSVFGIEFQGSLDSFRLSNTKRHTGTGSFTPPVAKYAWDANTMALLNFDQALVPNQPFFVCEAALSDPPAAASNLHYCRIGQGYTFVFNTKVQDIFLNCGLSTAGIVSKLGARSLIQNLFINQPAFVGMSATDGNSFFVVYKNCYVYFGSGYGVYGHGSIEDCTTQFNPIGVAWGGGNIINHNDNPAGNSFIPYIWGLGGDGNFGSIYARANSNDNEGSFPNQRCALLVAGNNLHNITSVGNTWAGFGNINKPVVIYTGTSLSGGIAEHIGEFFGPDTGALYVLQYTGSAAPGVISWEDCAVFPPPPTWTGDICNVPGVVTQRLPGKLTNYTGISISDTPANNLAGVFTILHGFTEGGPTFTVPEPDDDYIVVINYLGNNGSAPAAGSTTPGPYTARADGFTMDQGTDPGSDSQTIWSYVLVRTLGFPPLSLYEPSLPTTIANPYAGQTLHDFYLGATVLPVVGHAFRFQSDLGTEQIIEVGNGGSGDNFFGLAFTRGQQESIESGVAVTAFDSFIGFNDGVCHGFANPGPHNLVMANVSTGAFQTLRFYVDGGLYFGTQVGFTNPIVQPATIYVGELYDATQSLTVATIRTAKMDQFLSQVVTIEPDYGPGTIGGTDLGAFLGDNFTLGYGATSAGTGGFATQVAEARYGTSYYYIAAYAAQPGPAWVTNLSPDTGNGILRKFWVPWGNFQTLSSVCFLGGFNDILGGTAATVVWADIEFFLNGSQAEGTFRVPAHISTAPVQVPTWPIYDGQAWAEAYHFNVSNPTFTVAGVTFTATWMGDLQSTAIALAAAINANGTTGPLVTASAETAPDQEPVWFCLITANAKGSAGNGITTSSNGVGGAGWYPGTATAFGVDTICTIQGVDFVCNFDTDAATTCNNLITAINLSGPTLALITPTNVSNNLVATAVNAGSAGNSITTAGNFGGNSAWLNGPTLLGGANGAIQNAVPQIVLCTVPPFGDATGYTAGKETQRNALNTLIRAFVGAGTTIADVDIAVRKSADHTKIDPIYLAADNTNLNDAGHEAVFTLVAPLLPGVGTAPSALSYATNPASYASGGPIASNNPTVTGTVVRWTVSPPLPTGLVISSTTGHITGTPTTPTAAKDYIVGATNTAGTITVAVNITIT